MFASIFKCFMLAVFHRIYISDPPPNPHLRRGLSPLVADKMWFMVRPYIFGIKNFTYTILNQYAKDNSLPF